MSSSSSASPPPFYNGSPLNLDNVSVNSSDTDSDWEPTPPIHPPRDYSSDRFPEPTNSYFSHHRRPPGRAPGSPDHSSHSHRPHSPSQRPPMRNNTSSGFGKGKKRKNKVVNNKNKKNSNKNKKNRNSSNTIKVSGRTYKVQKGPRGGKFIRRGGKKVYISSKK